MTADAVGAGNITMKHRSRPLLIPAILLGLTFGSAAVAQVADTPGLVGCRADGTVAEQETFVSIGGIQQWVTVRGTDCANPVLLFVHGGPGNPLTPYADRVFGSWAKDFTLVQWDQRGAGKTWGRNPETHEDELTIEHLAADGTELAALLTRTFHQPKVILLGGSWGSMLGLEMIHARPDLFHAWVGASQMVTYRENQTLSYDRVTALARAAGDTDALSKLEALGPPPWTNPRNFGALRRLTRRYEGMATTPPPADWWVLSPAYADEAYQADYTGGEDYSYIALVGLNGDGMLSRLDQFARPLDFPMPVYLVQGEEDLVTMPSESRRFFDALTAPDKAYVLVPAAGHDPNAAMIEAEHAVLMDRVLPAIRGNHPAP